MDILLNTLQNFGVSQAIVKTISSLDLSFMDLIIDKKRENKLDKGYRKSAINKAVFAVKKMFDIININMLNDPMILISFNASKTAILKMNYMAEISSIDELEIFISDDIFFKKNGIPIWKSRIEIQKAVIEYREWQNTKEGRQYLEESKVLLKMFEMKKSDLNFLSKELHLNDLSDILNNLVQKNYLLNENDFFYFPNNLFYHQDEVNKIIERSMIVSLEFFLSSDIKDITLLKERLNGKTLQEIANNYGLTRERIRQKLANIPINPNEITEVKKYVSVFEMYNFSEKDFILLFDENLKVYNFLKLFCKKGIDEPKQYVLDMDIPITTKIKFFDQNQYIVTRNGQVKKVDKLEFFEEVLFKYRGIFFTSEEFYLIYQDESQGYPNLNLSVGTPRAIQGLVDRSNNVINSNNRRFRYFEDELLPDKLDIMNEMLTLPNGIYSMRKLFGEYTDFMEEIGIFNEYELHNLYKKNFEKITNDSVKLARSPEFVIGGIEKKNFVKDVLKEFSGENINDVIDYMYQEYGLRKNSMLSYIQTNFRQLLSGQQISAEYEKPTIETLDILRNHLVKDLYIRREIENIISEIPEVAHSFSRQLMHDIGYYVTGSTIFSKKYGNVKEAISEIVLKEKKYTRGDSLLDRSEVMGAYLPQLERDYKIVCISEDTYMRTDYLEKKGVTKKLMRSFIESVMHEYQDKSYFSFPQIVKNGFKHPLIDFGFEDIFYDRLLITERDMRPVTRFTPMIFKVSETPRLTLEIFLSDILIEYPTGVNLDDLIDDINMKYYQKLNRDRVKEELRKYGAYYSKTLDKFYFYKEQYLDEVYGK